MIFMLFWPWFPGIFRVGHQAASQVTDLRTAHNGAMGKSERNMLGNKLAIISNWEINIPIV